MGIPISDRLGVSESYLAAKQAIDNFNDAEANVFQTGSSPVLVKHLNSFLLLGSQDSKSLSKYESALGKLIGQSDVILRDGREKEYQLVQQALNSLYGAISSIDTKDLSNSKKHKLEEMKSNIQESLLQANTKYAIGHILHLNRPSIQQVQSALSEVNRLTLITPGKRSELLESLKDRVKDFAKTALNACKTWSDLSNIRELLQKLYSKSAISSLGLDSLYQQPLDNLKSQLVTQFEELPKAPNNQKDFENIRQALDDLKSAVESDPAIFAFTKGII